MKVLMIVPKYTESYGQFYQFPLGLGYIAAAIENAGHDLEVINLNHIPEKHREIVKDAIERFSPDVCATGGLSVFISQISAILNWCKEAKPSMTRIVGGGVVSGAPDEILDIVCADYGVVNEGEFTIQELLDALESDRDVNLVKGVIFRSSNGEVKYTGERSTEYNLTKFSWPAYENLQFESNINHQRVLDSYFFHTQEDNRPRALDMITSRSCPFKCTFCFHPTGKTYRERELSDFFSELDFLVTRFKPNMVALIDELFSLRRDRLLELCELIKPYNLKWMVQLHVRSVTEEVLRAMKEAGCTYISYGIESMSQEILKSMEKKSKVDQIQKALDLTRATGIGIQGNLLFGDSAETLETANESMGWWVKNRQFAIWLTPLLVFPGSPDHQEAVKVGLIKPEDRVSYVRDLPVSINITRMNDKNLEMLRYLLSVYGNTLLRPAPVLHFRETGFDELRRKSYYEIQWLCKDCDNLNIYDGVIIENYKISSLRLTCRNCRSRWDVQIQFALTNLGKNQKSSLLEKLICFTQEFMQKFTFALKNPNVTISKLRSFLILFTNSIVNNRRNSKNLISQNKISRLTANVMSEELLKKYGSSLKSNPFSPNLHIKFGEILASLGINGGAQAHLEQAKTLGAVEEDYNKLLLHLNSLAESDASRNIFFISWSSEPSPRDLIEMSNRSSERRLLNLIAN